jgi:hypothetical protein
MDKEKVLSIIKEIVAKMDYQVDDHCDGYLSLMKDEEQQLVVCARTVNTQTLLLLYTKVCSVDVDKLTLEKIKKINQINAGIVSKLFMISDDEESTSHSLDVRQDLFAFSEEQLQKSIPMVIEELLADAKKSSKELEDIL